MKEKETHRSDKFCTTIPDGADLSQYFKFVKPSPSPAQPSFEQFLGVLEQQRDKLPARLAKMLDAKDQEGLKAAYQDFLAHEGK